MNKKNQRTIANFVGFLKNCELEFGRYGCVEVIRPEYRQYIYKRDSDMIIFDVLTEDREGITKHVKHSFAEACAVLYMNLFESLREAE